MKSWIKIDGRKMFEPQPDEREREPQPEEER